MGQALIAIVDDDLDFLSLMAELLMASGYAALRLADAHMAVPRLCAARPVLILLDVHLGGNLNGWELLAELRCHPETARVPVIMLSGDVWALLGDNPTFSAPGVDVLQKPFRWDVLKARIERLLECARLATCPVTLSLPTAEPLK